MPSIESIAGSYSTKKSESSKIKFGVGERFSGRIVKSDSNSNEVRIRLSEGWEFSADLDKKLNDLPKGPVRFEVEGVEDGKIKLKLVTRQESKEELDAVTKFVKSQSLSDDDSFMVKKMIENKITLTRENINLIKSLLSFNTDIKKDGKMSSEFIKNYLQSNNISPESNKGIQIQKLLEDFFVQFKNMNDDDIMLFIKCGLDINSDNIKAYKSMMSTDCILYNEISDIEVALKNEDIHSALKDNIKNDQSINKEVKDINNKEVVSSNQNQYSKENVISAYSSDSKNVSMIGILKALSGNDNNSFKYILENTIKDSIQPDNKMINNSDIMFKINKIVKNLDDVEIIKLIKNEASLLGNSLSDMTTSDTNKVLSKVFGFNITLDDEQVNMLKEAFEYIDNTHSEENNNTGRLDKNQGNNNEVKVQNEDNNGQKIINSDNATDKNVKENLNEVLKDNKGELLKDLFESNEAVKDGVQTKVEEAKTVVKKLLDNINDNNVSSKIMNLVKDSITQFKVFNAISNQYYYMDLPLNLREEKYPCKLIVKDDRKDNKKLDSSNIKMVVTVSTCSIGTVDCYIKINNKHINLDFKCDEKFTYLIFAARSKLKEKLQDLGYSSDITSTKRNSIPSITSLNEFFNEEIKAKTLDIMV